MESIFLIPIGFLAGILAGYLGIGGGGIFMPVLLFFLAGSCSLELLPKLSVGTSKGAIVFTGLAGAIRHWRLSHISIPVWAWLSPGALLGAFFGGLVIKKLPGGVLTVVIGIVLFIAAIRMVTLKFSSEEADYKKARWWLPLAGFVIGIVSATVGVGGGIFAVPLMAGVLGMKTERAAGTSSAMVVVTSTSAVIGHIFWGMNIEGRPPDSLGFVCIPEALLLGIPAAIGAMIGAGLHKKFKAGVFKWVFAGLLAIVAIRIVFIS